MLSPKSLLDWTPAEARHGGFASGTQRVPEPERPLRSEEHTSELQSQSNLVCRLLLEKKIRSRVRGRRSAVLAHSPYGRPDFSAIFAHPRRLDDTYIRLRAALRVTLVELSAPSGCNCS